MVEATCVCPLCESQDIDEVTKIERVPYGDACDVIDVRVPVLTCKSCNFSFTDRRAEVLRHAAVCKAQGLLSPVEVRSVRESLGMSRKEFNEAYGIPPASMNRWENGKLFQNVSLDTLLRALQNKATADRLDRRRVVSEGATGVVCVFPTLQRQPELLCRALERQAGFKLRAGC